MKFNKNSYSRILYSMPDGIKKEVRKISKNSGVKYYKLISLFDNACSVSSELIKESKKSIREKVYTSILEEIRKEYE